MSRFFKIIEGNYLYSIGISNYGGIEITESEYNHIRSIINNSPKDTETHYYKLRADTLEYESIEKSCSINII